MSDGNGGIKLLAAVLGFWLIMRSINKDATGRTLVDHLLGQHGGANQKLPSSSSSAITSGGATDPVPGASGNRLDQGFDVTSKRFVSPFSGTVVASEQMDPGFAGGGYVAIQSASNPRQVEYFAEGLAPTVTKGETVTAGQQIAVPRLSPYPTGGFGTIETGPANPSDPLQPLAQVVKDPRAAVLGFYNWLHKLGAPAATTTSGAGYP